MGDAWTTHVLNTHVGIQPGVIGQNQAEDMIDPVVE